MKSKFDAYDCAKFKVDMEMSSEYLQAKRKAEWVEEIKKWFLCLPNGHYRFKGRWWREYEVERYYHIIHEKEVAVIYRWGGCEHDSLRIRILRTYKVDN